MVCNRCKTVLEDGIRKLGIPVQGVTLGRISFLPALTTPDFRKVEKLIGELGFETISSKKTRVVSQVKEIIEEVFRENIRYETRLRFSHLLSESLHMNYDSISTIFSELEGVTLEKYIITRRLEKVKELLVYTNFTLTEIAYITGFNSINHLSRQFKELTGLTPSYFKAIRNGKKNLSKSQNSQMK